MAISPADVKSYTADNINGKQPTSYLKGNNKGNNYFNEQNKVLCGHHKHYTKSLFCYCGYFATSVRLFILVASIYEKNDKYWQIVALKSSISKILDMFLLLVFT